MHRDYKDGMRMLLSVHDTCILDPSAVRRKIDKDVVEFWFLTL